MSDDAQLTQSVIKAAKPGSKESEGNFDLFTNFKHYKLPHPEIFIQDILRPSFKQKADFDAIICDPPFGIEIKI